MEQFKYRLSIREQLDLEEIGELIENIIKNPNKLLVQEILKLPLVLKKNIDSLDISKKQKEYYQNILANSDLLDEEDDKISIKSKQSYSHYFDSSDFQIEDKPSYNLKDEKILNMDFPKYPSLKTDLYNENFQNLSKKILFY